MALINNIYVHVSSGGESWDKGVDSTSHPVEKGIETTDTVRRKATTLSISGEIVDYGSVKAMSAVSKLEELKNAGSLITYIGRRAAKNLQIQSFNYDFTHEIVGGCNFSMELKEVRIAKKAYVAKATNTNTNKTVTPKVGDIVVFKGGNVYVSSDAKKAATTKGRQSCKVTIINERSWSLHDYHLISTEKKYPHNVYGWVDAKDIEGVTSAATPTNSTTNGGTQQVTYLTTGAKNVSGTKVFYTVKKGDTLTQITSKYARMGLVDDTGKGILMAWVKRNNGKAFSRSGALIVGSKMLMGYKK